jgi:hypothetical protein
LNRRVNLAMQGLGMSSGEIAPAVQGFLASSYGSLSFELGQALGSSATTSLEKAFAGALRHFAARTPATSKPPA